jgi:hypothetical protein
MKDERLWIRLTREDAERYRAAAQGLGATLSHFMRRAMDAAVKQKPILTPVEVEAFDGIREQLRRAGYNLDHLLHQVHLHQNGVTDNGGPSLDDYRDMLAEIRGAMSRIDDCLSKLP